MIYYDIMDKEEKGTFIRFEDKEQAEKWLSEQEDRASENSLRYGMHIVEKEVLTIEERNKKAFAIANNAIYFNDRADYLGALWEVCMMLQPQNDDIGKKYLKE